MISRRNSGWVVGITMLALALASSSCGSRSMEGCEPKGNPSEDGSNSNPVEPLLTAAPLDPTQIEVIWQEGPHADTYVITVDNTNSSCARCHSPLNWAPASEELPASWTDSQVETAPPAPLISESDWHNVGCSVCHRAEKDQITGEFAWLEIAPKGEYSEVATSTVLCQKCHRMEDDDGHRSISVEGGHSEFLCTDCHDAHDTKATCSSAGCHEPFAAECESIETHDRPHSDVTCSACHDGGDPEIDWNEEVEAWDTFRLVETKLGVEFQSFSSHNIVLDVNCDRCHAPGDHPWDPQNQSMKSQ